MNIILSNSNGIPIFEQIENAIKEAIFSNELKEEDMLPSVRNLANDLKISFLTVKRAYDELEQAGFIKTVQGKGSFVAPKNLELIKEEKLKEIQDYVEKVYNISKIANISEDEVKELFRMIFEGIFSMENKIELQNVSKKYKDFELKNISFNVPQGCIVGLIGENGAGKTTTIKSILNITKSEGSIKIFGKDNKKNEKEIKEETGVVLDDSFLSEYLTAKQVNFVMKDFYKTWDENKYIRLLKQFNLPTDKLLKDFSSGMKMKLKIATAISHNPKLLILDEPTSGLDPVVRNEILDIFRKYIEEDETRSILLSTHITTDLEHISDYIVFIEKGKIIFDLPTDELLENYGIIKCSREDFIRLDEKDYIAYKKGKYQYEVLTNDKSAIRGKYNILTIDKPSIEDIMLFYIKGEK